MHRFAPKQEEKTKPAILLDVKKVSLRIVLHNYFDWLNNIVFYRLRHSL